MASENFERGVKLIEEAYKDSLKEFIAWLQKNWQLPPSDKKWPYADEPPPSEEYRKGHDDLLNGLDLAIECFMDDFD